MESKKRLLEAQEHFRKLYHRVEEKQTLSTCVKVRPCSLSFDGPGLDPPKRFQAFMALASHLICSPLWSPTKQHLVLLVFQCPPRTHCGAYSFRWASVNCSSTRNTFQGCLCKHSQIYFTVCNMLNFSLRYLTSNPDVKAILLSKYFESSDNISQHLVFCLPSLNGLPKSAGHSAWLLTRKSSTQLFCFLSKAKMKHYLPTQT